MTITKNKTTIKQKHIMLTSYSNITRTENSDYDKIIGGNM